jgi:membrane-bound serine protease (ClpP class)
VTRTGKRGMDSSRRQTARLVSWLVPLLLLLAGWRLTTAAEDGESKSHLIRILRIDGAIGPIVANYFDDQLADAARDSASLVVLELDTPGGLDTSMRQMVRAILSSPVPVGVYVAPAGARAASAGVFLVMASQVAGMAPATNIGAAHPVNMGGKLDDTMAEKVTNDAVAYLQSLAKQRGRNVEWAENVVRESVSVTAEEARDLGIVEIIAPDLPTFLKACDGLRYQDGSGGGVLHTAHALLERRPLSWRDRFLQRITDPTVAYIFLLLGFYGLFFELSNPGSLLPGIVGAICLLLAFLAFQSLPVNYVGVLLILVGLIMLLLEVKVTSYGALTIGGVIALVLGSLLMFDAGNPFGSVPFQVMVPAVVVTVFFFLAIVGLGLAAQRRRPYSGQDALAGQLGEVIKDDGLHGDQYAGRLFIDGEYWEYRCATPLKAGQSARVVKSQGRCLLVEPVDIDEV